MTSTIEYTFFKLNMMISSLLRVYSEIPPESNTYVYKIVLSCRALNARNIKTVKSKLTGPSDKITFIWCATMAGSVFIDKPTRR